MDKIPLTGAQAPAIVPHAKPRAAEPQRSTPVYPADAVADRGLRDRLSAAQAKEVPMNEAQRETIAAKKATCPFIGAAVATGALPVRNTEDRPLASVDDVAALGNSGGGDLGEVLRFFANGNHTKMLGPSGALDLPVPSGLFSLDFPGSQGSHPGHSGILQGDPTELNSGRLSRPDLDRLLGMAEGGYLKRSDVAEFIAENLLKDPDSKVFGTKAAGLLLGDLGGVAATLGPTVLQKLKQVTGLGEAQDDRRLYEALTKALGEDNLVGSAGEFGLLMSMLANSPKTREIDGEPAVAVEDLTAMFQDHRFPEGWETWPKTRHDWITNTTALLLHAGKRYVELKD